MKTEERDFLLGKIAGDQESIFREIKEMKDNDLKSIDSHLATLNGNVADNATRSIQNEAWIKAFKWTAIIGIPSGVTLLVTYCKGLW